MGTEPGSTQPSRTASGTEQRRPAKPHKPGGLRRRFLRYHLPIALASSGVLLVFTNLTVFDIQQYPPPGAIFAEGVAGAIPDAPYPPTPGAGSPEHAEQMAVPASGGAPAQHGGGDDPGAPADRHNADAAAAPTVPPGQHGGAPSATTVPAGDRHAGHTAGAATAGGLDNAGGAGAERGASSAPAAAPSEGSQHEAGATQQRMRQLSFATGYAALGLLAITLLIGPANLLLRRRIPVSSYFRRDVGLWTAAASVAHVVFSLLVGHVDGTILGYFFARDDRSRVLTNSFGLANWAGLAAVIIVALLTVVSSDVALRKLKARRWKKIQRWNYVLFALVIVHAVLYGALWRMESPFTILLAVSFVLVIVGQAVGVRLWRRRRVRTAATALTAP